MSTLINIAMAIAASLLSITGVHRSYDNAPKAEIIQCEHIQKNMNTHYIIKNEQLSQIIK
jgi:hypothetical protein